MQYLEQVLSLTEDLLLWLGNYVEIMFAVAIGLVALDFLWGLMRNPYRKAGRQLRRQTRKLRETSRLGKALKEDSVRLPKCYAHQYTAYLTSRSGTPSSYFVFSERKSVRGLFFLTAAVLLLLLGVGGNMLGEVCLLCLAALFAKGVAKLKQKLNKKSARKTFAKFLVSLDGAFAAQQAEAKKAITLQAQPKISYCEDKDVEDVVNKINFLRSSGIDENTSRDIAQLLSSDKLNRPRTLTQQRQINLALNGLLQVLSRKQTENKQTETA